MIDTQKAAQQHKMQMAEAVEKVKAKAVIYENEIKKQAELIDKNKNEIWSAEKNMTDAVEELIRDLLQHERNMKAKFHEIYEAQQKHHATKLENFELVVTQMKSCIERGESILERNFSHEILQTNQAIIGRCEELLNARKPDIYKPPRVHYMVDKKVGILDRIVSDTDPTLSLVEGQLQKEVEEKKETNFTIVTRDLDGLQCYHGDDQIKVDILTPAGDQLETEINDTKDGKHTVTYTPQCAGQHRVEIQVNGQPLTGSPWVVQVVPHQYQFAFQFGSTGKGQGEFNKPRDIAVSEKTETIAVADYVNKRIQMFRSDGIFLREIGLKNQPTSLAFTESGDILACIPDDDNNLKLSLFTEGGQFIRHFNGEHLERPFDISFESDGRIITCDHADNKIKFISPDGKDLLQSFSAPGCDVLPWFAVYHQDTFFVSYPKAHCVKVFSNTGLYQYDIGCEGSGDGQLMYPSGLVIDTFNHLIVCDALNQRPQVFSLDGKFISKIEGPFFVNSQVVGIAMSSNGNLFVTDFKRNCIYVLK